MKRIAMIIMLILMLSITTTTVWADALIGSELTVSEAQSQAETNSRQAAIDDLEIKGKEAAWDRAKEDAVLASSSEFGIEGVLTKRIRREVKPMEAEAVLELAKMIKSEHSAQLKLDIKNSFLNILLAQKELETASKKLKFSKERLEMAEAKYAINSITEQDLESAQNDVFSKTIDAEAIVEKLKILDIKLKDQMGLPLDGDQLVLKGSIEPEKLLEVDIEKAVTNSMEKDMKVYSACKKADAAIKTMELTEALFKPGNETYEGYEIEQAKALRDYEAAMRNREITVRNTYNELLNLKDSMEVADKYEELMLKKLDNAKIKLDNGQLSKDAYITAEEQYNDAFYSKYKAICEFNIKKDEFLNLI